MCIVYQVTRERDDDKAGIYIIICVYAHSDVVHFESTGKGVYLHVTHTLREQS